MFLLLPTFGGHEVAPASLQNKNNPFLQ